MRANRNCKWYVECFFCSNPKVPRSWFGFGERKCIPHCGCEEPREDPLFFCTDEGIEIVNKIKEEAARIKAKENEITHQLIFKTVEEDFMGEKIKEDKEIEYLLGSDGEIYRYHIGWSDNYIKLSKSKSKVIKDKLKSGELYTAPKWG